MPFIPFFQSTNLMNPVLEEGLPWDFAPDNLDEVRAMPKDVRRGWAADPATEWNVYSPVRGVAFNQRVNKANAAAGLRGIVADYDMKTTIPEVLGYLNQIAPVFVPNFIEVSLGKRIRLVWVFEREVLIPNARFRDAVLDGMMELIGAKTLLAGYDIKSAEAQQVWTNGGEWHDVNPKPMPWDVIFGLLCKISKRVEFGESEIPLETVYEKVRLTYPGRWQGEFKLNALGVRFWDERADNTNGCQVKPDGMLCFTGNVPFMKWEQIFGASWVNEQRSTNLGRAAGDIYYDGYNYWEQKCARWYPSDRIDILLRLKARGLSGSVSKANGGTVSEAERVLDFIQNQNRVDGAAPLINQRPGIATLDGKRVLNISTVKALEPAPDPATPEHFPWLWKFLNGLFDRPQDGSLNYFLAWLQRAYSALYRYERAMGQAVFLCGPKENGKSLLCFKIIKPLLGNQIANPYDYFTGATQFNEELFESPLLAINDEEAPANEQARQKFLARLKSFAVNPSHTYHPKFCKRVNVEYTGRLFTTLNDDPTSVGLLPEVNSNTADKLMFFGSRPYAGDWEKSSVIEPRIETELPLFARWLLGWTPPAGIVTPGRMGVKSYFDKRILALSRQQMPAYTLVEVIGIWMQSVAIWPEDKTEWQGTPGDLLSDLGNCDNLRANVKEWDARKIQIALRTLSQLSETGVELLADDGERRYKLLRAKLDRNFTQGKSN